MRGADDALKCDFFIPLFIPRLHDPANVQQISSKRRAISTRILNTLLEVCWTFAGSCKRGIYFVDVVWMPVSVLEICKKFSVGCISDFVVASVFVFKWFFVWPQF